MRIDVWSDVVCPWCAIGRARWVAALADFPHRDLVHIRWRSFELDPGAPREYPGPLADKLAAKYRVSVEQARDMYRQMMEVGAGDGLDFRFDRARSGNTFDAHRLLHHAAQAGGPLLQDRLKERLFRAYLTDGEPIGDHQALARVAGDAGLVAEEAAAVLAGDSYAVDVRADEREAADHGITAVPFSVIDDTYALPGAQPVGALRRVLDKAWAARPTTPAAPAGTDPGPG